MIETTVDFGEARLKRDRLALVVNGRDGWDLRSSSGVWVDPVTQTLMLTPLPLTPEWQTTSTGAYARIRRSDTDANIMRWIEYPRGFEGNYYLHSVGLADLHADRLVTTTASYPKNRPMYLTWLAYNYGPESWVQMECGWVAPSEDVSLRFWSTGQVEVWRGNNYLATHTLAGDRDGSGETPWETQAMRDVVVLLIPCRRRSLVVVSNAGGGFEHVFDDLSPDDPDPDITGAGPFWTRVPYGQATYQWAPLKFRDEGYAVSACRHLRFAPTTGVTHSTIIYADAPGYGLQSIAGDLMECDGTTNFVADGLTDTARVRIDLSGDFGSTYYVYGAASVLDALRGSTPDDPVELSDFIVQHDLSVGESPDSVQYTCVLKQPDTVQTLAPALARVDNRPIKVEIDGVPAFVGRTRKPVKTEAWHEQLERITLECDDLWRVLDAYQIREPVPLDGMDVSDAIELLATLVGFELADLDIEVTGYHLPTIADSSRGEWAVIPEVGDTAGEWIKRLRETFAPNWELGFVPTVMGRVLRFVSLDSLGTTPSLTRYLAQADAVSDGESGDDPTLWLRAFREQVIAPECNEITVTGWDPRTRQPVQARYVDLPSADPTLAAVDRPDNWLGEFVPYGLVNSMITSTAVAEDVIALLVPRLTSRRTVADWECELLVHNDGVPLWRGDVVRVYGRGDYRIKRFDVSFRIEHDASGMIRRSARYHAERIAEWVEP